MNRSSHSSAFAAALLLASALVALDAGPAGAAPPGNDAFAAREAVILGSAVTVDLSEATTEASEPEAPQDCINPDGQIAGARTEHSVWFTFAASSTGEVQFDTLATEDSSRDTVISVYTGASLDSLMQVACNDQASNGMNLSRVNMTVQAGTTYALRVAMWTSDEFPSTPGPATLSVTEGVPPTNDEPGPDIPDLGAGSVDGDTTLATVGDSDGVVEAETGCSLQKTVWFRVDVPAGVTGSVQVAAGGFDLDLDFVTLDGDSSIVDRGCAQGSGQLLIPGGQGTSYVRAGSPTGQGGSFTLVYGQVLPPDVSLSGTVGKGPGATVRLAYQATPAQDTSGTVFTLPMPAGLTARSATTPGGTCTLGASVTCELAPLTRLTPTAITVLAVPSLSPGFTLEATVSPDEDPSNDVVTLEATAKAICDNRAGINDDTAKGTRGADILCGLAGNDRLDGSGGNDVLLGGIGADTLMGGDGKDRLYGERDNDALVGGAAKDFLSGGAGRDSCKDAADTRRDCER